MTHLIDRMRQQAAVYWPPGAADNYGKATPGDLVPLVLADDGTNYRVRWEDLVEQYTAGDGTTRTSSARVFVPQLPDGTEVAVGGWLWLGSVDDLTDATTPANNPNAYQVQQVRHTPSRRTDKVLREAIL